MISSGAPSYDRTEPRRGWYVDDGVWEINWEEFGSEHLVRAPGQGELFHWAPRSERTQITAEGLKAAVSGADISGVYLTSSPADWATLHDTEEADLWVINAEGLDLFYDPEMMGGADTDFLCLGDIPPERLLRRA